MQFMLSVDEAAKALRLHPKTVLRHIRAGRLPAARVGKAYRILRGDLDAFGGFAEGSPGRGARSTSIVEIDANPSAASAIATFVQAAALARDPAGPPMQVQTAFDPEAHVLKIVAIGALLDIGRLLDMLHWHLEAQA